jgi:tetratricopeptide (TPR) repeat protein
MLDWLKFLFSYTYTGTRGGYRRLKKQVLLSVCIFASVRNADLTIVPSLRNRGNSQPGSRNGSAILGPMPVRNLVRDLRVAFGVSKFRRLAILGTGYLGACLALSVCVVAAPADLPVFRPNDPVTRSGFERFYNMDYARAIEDMEKVAAQHPDDPYAVNNLANTYLIRELFRMGALDPTDYANDSFVGTPQRPATTEAKNKIKELLERATGLEEARLRTNPNDVEALYARGVTRGMRSSYMGLIDRSWLTALRSAVGSRHDHEQVLELSPTFTDAKLIVGTHDYVVGSLPWAVKMAASLVGFSGNRERGIEELYAASKGGGEASIDAKILLALFLRREGRFDEALTLVREMTQEFPQNVIVALEEGDLLRAAHRDREAVTAYRKVWDAGHAGHFPFGSYELSAVNMGETQRALKDDAGALASYNLMEEVTHAAPELRQRAALGAGEIYDLQQRRDLAVKKYNLVIGLDGSSKWADAARKYLREPYR